MVAGTSVGRSALGGEMAWRIAARDWSSTPLGPMAGWSPALRTTVQIALDSRFPMILWWGPELVVLYNDSYAPILGAKHPGALGESGISEAVWGEPEVRQVIEPMLRGVLERGRATWSEDQLLILERLGFPEETYFTWSYSPVYDGPAVAGVFTAVFETTDTVLRARRLRLLAQLTEATTEAPSIEEVCRRTAAVAGHYPRDVPLLQVYLVDDDGPRLVAGSGPAFPGALRPPVERWAAAAQAGRRLVDLESLDWMPPSRIWPEPLARTAVLPLAAAGERRVGFLVVGLSPRLPHAEDYLTFLDLLAARVSSAIRDATALEGERRRSEALAELDRSKSAFFSNVSHEFRTPLTLMLGPLDQALSDGDTVPWALQRDRLETAWGNGLRLLKLVNSLLDFSSIEAGHRGVTLTPTDLGELTGDLVSVFRSAFAAAGLELVVDLERLDEPVDLDTECWETVIFNLLSNALKYTHKERWRSVCAGTRTGSGSPSPTRGSASTRPRPTGSSIASTARPTGPAARSRGPGSGWRWCVSCSTSRAGRSASRAPSGRDRPSRWTSPTVRAWPRPRRERPCRV
jgi:signal transduction histidine kinase